MCLLPRSSCGPHPGDERHRSCGANLAAAARGRSRESTPRPGLRHGGAEQSATDSYGPHGSVCQVRCFIVYFVRPVLAGSCSYLCVGLSCGSESWSLWPSINLRSICKKTGHVKRRTEVDFLMLIYDDLSIVPCYDK